MELDDLAVGKAGEYLVCADLILKGYTAFPSEQGLPYDIVADINGRLLKVQVKTTHCPRPIPQRVAHISSYIFHVKRRGNKGRGSYQDGIVDLFALVAIDANCIAYLNPEDTKQTMCFRSPLLRGTYLDEIIESRCDEIRADKASGMKNHEIATKHNLDRSSVGRVFLHPSKYVSGSPYLDSFSLYSALEKIAANDNRKEVIAA